MCAQRKPPPGAVSRCGKPASSLSHPATPDTTVHHARLASTPPLALALACILPVLPPHLLPFPSLSRFHRPQLQWPFSCDSPGRISDCGG